MRPHEILPSWANNDNFVIKLFHPLEFGILPGFVGEYILVDGVYGAAVCSTKLYKKICRKFPKFSAAAIDRRFQPRRRRSATLSHDWIPHLQCDLLHCSSSPNLLAPEICLLFQNHPRSTSTVPKIPSGPSCNLHPSCRRVPRLHRIHSVHGTWMDILRRIGCLYVRDTNGTSLTIQNTVTPRIPSTVLIEDQKSSIPISRLRRMEHSWKSDMHIKHYSIR